MEKEIFNYAEVILKYCPQLFLRNYNKSKRYKIEAIASSVLICFGNDYFMLTAGHVIEDNDPEKIGVVIDNVFKILDGELKYLKPSDNGISNHIDIAIWRLNAEIVQDLKKAYDFLEPDNLLFKHDNKKISQNYLVVGFPWRKSNPDIRKNKIKVKPFVLLTRNTDNDVYHQLKINKTLNLLLEYRQRKIINIKSGFFTKGVTPEGISGCGVFHLDSDNLTNSQNLELRLLAVTTEQDKNRRYLQTTRIDIIYELLRRSFNLNISPLNIVEIH
jgi:hypothetical protein